MLTMLADGNTATHMRVQCTFSSGIGIDVWNRFPSRRQFTFFSSGICIYLIIFMKELFDGIAFALCGSAFLAVQSSSC
jgi:hypothetical protein